MPKDCCSDGQARVLWMVSEPAEVNGLFTMVGDEPEFTGKTVVVTDSSLSQEYNFDQAVRSRQATGWLTATDLAGNQGATVKQQIR